ncbi:V-type ATP synthase subunit I [Mangrovibacterium sp.]|uniref:V-type ATP synthase subunit I n=1 Tax=Mangrovibacterium sp. TaxID=1961364 RepID=UPI00356A50C0
MIVPMKKYGFAVQHSAYKQFLDDLSELGVVHINKGSGNNTTEEMANLRAEAAQIEQTIDSLKHYHPEGKQPGRCEHTATEVIEQARIQLKRLEEAEAELELAQKQASEREVWGNYSSEILQKLNDAGLKINFYSVPVKKWKAEWLDEYPIEVVKRCDKEVKFITIGYEGEPFEGVRLENVSKSTAVELHKQAAGLQKEIAAVNDKLHHMGANGIPILKNHLANVESRLEWLDVWNNQTTDIGDGALHLLEGWVPEVKQLSLQEYLEKNHIFYLESKPEPGEAPPVQLVNNKFGKLFEPIAKLFSLPAYAELDLTIYFAPFFMLFFGFCLGDAGYGLVILLGSTFYKRKAEKSMRTYLTLGQLFGASTLVMGAIFGTFFGIELAKQPALEGVKDMFLDSAQVFNLSLIVGGIQIIFGIIIRVKNQLRQENPLRALSSVGWLLLFFTAGLFSFFLKDLELSAMLNVVKNLLYAASVLLILLFSGTGPIHLRLIGGLWEMYNTVTGIFGDLLSYIRLFALGIASSILGLVINQMAASFGSGKYIGPVIFLLIVVVGHTANLLISSLGAFVHPMRLTFVEFYKNAGFQGGGKPYKPFSKK